jgi:hypothetical protein
VSDTKVPSRTGRPEATGQTRPPVSTSAADTLTAVALLGTALSDRGISSRIKAVDAETAMLTAGEQIVLCRDGCFWWRTGKFREGRAVTAVHAAADPAGAARRLARYHAAVALPLSRAVRSR